jgi:hypothetical protein
VTEGASTDRSGNGPAPEGEAPRLQDTVERESVRLPLPDEPAEASPERDPDHAAPEAEPAAGRPETEPAAEPAVAPGPDPTLGSMSAADESDPGPSPELLVGAAFAGGLLLALLLRRLRS